MRAVTRSRHSCAALRPNVRPEHLVGAQGVGPCEPRDHGLDEGGGLARAGAGQDEHRARRGARRPAAARRRAPGPRRWTAACGRGRGAGTRRRGPAPGSGSWPANAASTSDPVELMPRSHHEPPTPAHPPRRPRGDAAGRRPGSVLVRVPAGPGHVQAGAGRRQRRALAAVPAQRLRLVPGGGAAVGAHHAVPGHARAEPGHHGADLPRAAPALQGRRHVAVGHRAARRDPLDEVEHRLGVRRRQARSRARRRAGRRGRPASGRCRRRRSRVASCPPARRAAAGMGRSPLCPHRPLSTSSTTAVRSRPW